MAVTERDGLAGAERGGAAAWEIPGTVTLDDFVTTWVRLPWIGTLGWRLRSVGVLAVLATSDSTTTTIPTALTSAARC